jgi:nucleoid DNA-binding protein
MTPRRANDMIPDLAAEAGLDESQMRGILNQFWGMVLDQLDKGDKCKVYLSNLGTFEAIPKAVTKRLERYRRFRDATDLAGKRSNRDTVKRLESIVDDMTIQKKEKERIRALRRAMNSGSTQALEEPETDI